MTWVFMSWVIIMRCILGSKKLLKNGICIYNGGDIKIRILILFIAYDKGREEEERESAASRHFPKCIFYTENKSNFLTEKLSKR